MGSVADSIMDTSSRSIEERDEPQRKFVVLNRIRSIESDALFSDGDQVFILHRGRAISSPPYPQREADPDQMKTPEL